jgi:carboxypeptidase family protein/TonB-dependent receptor-like protein
MKPLRSMLAVFLCVLGTSVLAHAQGVGASGDISGTVTDPSGAVVPNATVTATEAEKGLKRTSLSDNRGEYHFTALPPASYEVSAQISGFQTAVYKGVIVNVGQTVVLDFHLKVSQTSEQVEVTTEPPVVETEKSHQADTINEQYIRDLPINRRDYLTFTLLAPGVNDSTRLSADQDFRVKQTPQSGLSFYGSNGRGNSVTVDGGEANDDAGGVRLTLSQDAVQEFQINRSNYNAELGGASGASINIVSKTGTNDLHGSLYGFFRNDAMDARNPFAITQALQPGQTFNPAAPDVSGTRTKDSLSRQQTGGTVGFPIVKDKTFLFASIDGLRQDAQNAVPMLTNTTEFRPDNGGPLVKGVLVGNNQQAILTGLATEPGNPPVPCLTGQPALPAATCAAILQNILTINPATSPLSAFLVNQFENNGGLHPYNTRVYQVSARLDHQFSDRNQAYLRYSFAHDLDQSPDVQSLTGFSRGSSVQGYDSTIQGAWFHQFSARTQNELRGQWNYTNFNVIPNVPGQAGLDIPGFGNFGTQIFLPSLTIMRRPEIADNFSVIHGHHTMKTGFYELYRGNHTESHTFFPGRFVFGNLPGGILSPCLQVPAACGLSASPAVINALQSASLGLPQFYQQGFGNPIYNYPRPLTAAYWQDSWAMTSNFTLNFGVRYELDSQYGALNSDKDNFAPRVSFAWDPFKNHKTVIRAGYGIFYSPIYGQIADVVQTLGFVNGVRPIAQVFVPLTGAPGNPSLTSAAIFQTLFAQGKIQCTTPAPGQAACITPADLTQFGINITNVGPPPPLSVVFSGQPNYQNPYSQQAEFGIERAVGKDFSVSLSGIYVHTLRLPVAIDTNALPAFTTTVIAANGQPVTVHNWNSRLPNPLNAAPCAGANILLCFANPLLLQTDQYSSRASALYEGAILEVKKRFSNHFTLLGNYTFSKAFDTTSDFNSDFGPADQTNLGAERGLSNFDQRHKVVFAGVLDTPGKNPVLSGFEFSPIVRYNSGHPFDLLAGADVNGDRHSTNDRPIGAARNTGQGPDTLDFDMRLTRQFHLGEKAKLQFMAEAFNLINRANFASANNVVGAACKICGALGGTFNLSGSSNGFRPTDPSGFTSALSPRQVQLGVRLSF